MGREEKSAAGPRTLTTGTTSDKAAGTKHRVSSFRCLLISLLLFSFLLTCAAVVLASLTIHSPWAKGKFSEISLRVNPVNGKDLKTPIRLPIAGEWQTNLTHVCIMRPKLIARCLTFEVWNERFKRYAASRFGLKLAKGFQYASVFVGALTGLLLLLQIVRDCVFPHWWKRDIWLRFVAALLNIVVVFMILIAVLTYASSGPGSSVSSVRTTVGEGGICDVVAAGFMLVSSVLNFTGHFYALMGEGYSKSGDNNDKGNQIVAGDDGDSNLSGSSTPSPFRQKGEQGAHNEGKEDYNNASKYELV